LAPKVQTARPTRPRIAAAGRLSGGNTDRLAVIGGTGAYAGARGTLSSVNGATRTVDTIELLP
jgi:hypothetical protein